LSAAARASDKPVRETAKSQLQAPNPKQRERKKAENLNRRQTTRFDVFSFRLFLRLVWSLELEVEIWSFTASSRLNSERDTRVSV
jgi:hypothetical protein